mgnify:CR=1 FL=1
MLTELCEEVPAARGLRPSPATEPVLRKTGEGVVGAKRKPFNIRLPLKFGEAGDPRPKGAQSGM